MESNAERRDLTAARYNCPAFPCWNAARGAAAWTVGVIATPAHFHIPLALELLDSGLDVLIEKPLAVWPARGPSNLLAAQSISRGHAGFERSARRGRSASRSLMSMSAAG